MSARYFALIFGLVYIGVGLLGFVPAFRTVPTAAPALAVEANYGYLLGLFPVNLLHNLVHVALGVWGVVAYRSHGGARAYARSLTIIFGVLAVLGLFPATNTLFGLTPLFGHDVWLHAVTALIAAYFGFMAPHRDVIPADVNMRGQNRGI